MAETEEKKIETVRDLLGDPTFATAPLLVKNERFQKVAANDHDFQKMSDEGQSYVHQKLFSSITAGTAPSATGAPVAGGKEQALPQQPFTESPEGTPALGPATTGMQRLREEHPYLATAASGAI